MKNLSLFILFLCCFISAKAQFVFEQNHLPDEISILEYSTLANVGLHDYSIEQIKGNPLKLKFVPLKGRFGNLGFTHHTYWLKFELKNNLKVPLLYYTQTAEPVTNNVNLYLIDALGKIEVQQSGDNLDFAKRSVDFRKTFFKIELAPGETKQAYIEIKNDGEKNSLPLILISQQRLLEITYHDQLVMGIFYGILLVIAITYFFFYFALKEISFLYYSVYVIVVGLCQFALDGFYHQYINTSNSWFSLHAVIISAIFSCYFFGKYSEMILEIKVNNPFIHKCFKPLYVLLGCVLVAIVIFPSFLKYSYPIINLLTLIGILLIFFTIATMMVRKQKIDRFYFYGILILFLCIILAILKNFGLIPGESFSTENITKPGIGLEIIALSLSMANRIRLLKTEQEGLQALALQKSEEMNDIKSYFLSNMSHELRTPLNAILGLASMMENESNDPKVRANCEVIRYASHGLISSVNDILDFSKIEKGELELENSEFKPTEIFEKLRSGLSKQIEDKGLKFEYHNSISQHTVVIGDPMRLEQLIYNILGNAIKFTSKGLVSFEANSKFENDMLRLSILITDTGVGIPKQKLDSVFELFNQTTLDNKRKFGGFGIGLSIVKALVDLHQGKIDLRSVVNEGTTCEITLDYQVVPNLPDLVPAVIEEKTLRGKHILIVEDNPMNQMVIEMMLSDWEDTTVSIANDGAECLEMMQKRTVDVILMDLQMPVMDGYEAINAIRTGTVGEDYAEVPIIVITADITKNTKDRIFDLGANDYMNKPVEQDMLYSKIKSIFGAS
ncbi:hybrid sensor histidine kinase/response regulator [Pedobacter yonginense]|uniref:histidine kinase n=1 Tax=Pedobacter yonginense TaxID=651869 RepID=A0A317ESJ0_9SPHI|nr:hybrid sensor histidine kinase/response regulator [Pedobacter yonginense]PWS28833.1 hybrid sensor histidine kinase/response regulator [Pedobacter yonginense]